MWLKNMTQKTYHKNKTQKIYKNETDTNDPQKWDSQNSWNIRLTKMLLPKMWFTKMMHTYKSCQAPGPLLGPGQGPGQGQGQCQGPGQGPGQGP